MVSSTKAVGTTGQQPAEIKNKTPPDALYKNQFPMDQGSKSAPRKHQIIREKQRSTVQDTGFGKNFLEKSLKA